MMESLEPSKKFVEILKFVRDKKVSEIQTHSLKKRERVLDFFFSLSTLSRFLLYHNREIIQDDLSEFYINNFENQDEFYNKVNLIAQGIQESDPENPILSGLGTHQKFEGTPPAQISILGEIEKIPKRPLELFLDEFSESDLSGEFLTVEEIKSESFSPVASLTSKINTVKTQSIERKYFLKVFFDTQSALKEEIINTYFYGAYFLHSKVPRIIDLRNHHKHFEKDLVFTLTQDINETRNDSLLLYDDSSIFAELKMATSDPYNQKLLTIAQFHVESKNLIYLSRKTNSPSFIFRRLNELFKEDIAPRRKLERRLNKILTKDKASSLIETYSTVVRNYNERIKRREFDERILSHGDPHINNWEGKKILDFGNVSLGESCADVELILANLPEKDRKEYRRKYLKIREFLEEFYSQNYKKPTLEKYTQRCIERGFEKSLRIASGMFSRGNQEMADVYFPIAQRYRQQLRRIY